MAFSDAYLEDLQARVPVSEVATRSGLKLIRAGAEFKALSPFNDEKTPSFTINDQKKLFACFSSGKTGNVFGFLMETKGLSFPDAVKEVAAIAGVAVPNGEYKANGSSPPKSSAAPVEKKDRVNPVLVSTYQYLTIEGDTSYEVCRFEPKTFRQRRPAPGHPGAWVWGLDAGEFVKHDKYPDFYAASPDRTPAKGWNVRIVMDEAVTHGLFNFPEIMEEMRQEEDDRRIVFNCEGEKDCLTLGAWNLLATTNSGGAKHWQPHLAEYLRGADVVILLDNDKPGRERGEMIARSLHGIAKRIRILDWKIHWPDVPEKGDVTDWRDQAEGSKEKLYEIIEKLAPWSPAPYKSDFGAVTWKELGVRKQAYEYLIQGLLPVNERAMITGAPGCLAADTELYYELRDDAGRRKTQLRCTIRRLYERFNRIKVGGYGFRIVPADRHFWMSSVGESGNIFKNKVIGVVASGTKQCFRLTTADGRSVVATGDHKFLSGNQYVSLRDLKVGDDLYVNNGKMKGRIGEPKVRLEKRVHIRVKNHPTARVKKHTDGYVYQLLRRSRAVVEASMNALSLQDYIACLNSGNVSLLKFIEKGLEVHHKNEDRSDDRLDNLEVLTRTEHRKRHARHALYFADHTHVASISDVGIRETYDVQMDGPHHNFMAAGIVVHNSGKSFVATDMGLAIARGVPYEGRRVRRAGVIYASFEGGKGFPNRVEGYRQWHGLEVTDDVPFVMLTRSADLFGDEEVMKKIQIEIEHWAKVFLDMGTPLGLVVLDTVSASSGVMDENHGSDVAKYLANGRIIGDSFNCTILYVHHVPKNGTGPRGSSKFTGDLETTFTVRADNHGACDENGRPIKILHLDKQREGEGNKDIKRFVLRQMEIGRDEYDEPMTTCVLLPPGGDAKAVAKRGFHPTPQETKVFRALLDALEKSGTAPDPTSGVPTTIERVVTYAQWRDAFMAIDIDGDEEESKRAARVKQAMKRGGESLMKFKIIGMKEFDARNKIFWHTGEPVRGFPETFKKQDTYRRIPEPEPVPMTAPGDDEF